MSIIQGNAHTSAGGYQIERSLRFNSADSAYLNRTPASAGNLRTWTWSAWVKRSKLGDSVVRLFNAQDSGSPFLQTSLRFDTDQLRFYNDANSTADVKSSAVYRDASAWYHIVCAIDTTQATAANRVKLYVNGSQVTALATATYPNQNTDMYVNAARAHQIGSSITPSQFFDGYMTETYFIDGQALTPSSFGETDSNTGVWKPKAFSGTYGTNGFYLKFADNSGTTSTTLGKDSSGNGNNWTPNNFSVTDGAGNDSLVDSPTSYGTDTGVGGSVRGNYATLNPLNNLGSSTLSNGNLDFVTGTTTYGGVKGTIGASSGKWYWEVTATDASPLSVGIQNSSGGVEVGADANGWGYLNDARKYNTGSATSYGASYTDGDVIGVALDLDAGTLTFYKNGSSQGVAFSSLASNTYFPAVSDYSSSTSAAGSCNFGQRAFAYTAPSGFKALCTTNLPTPTIGATSTTLAGKYFNPVLYTGNGASRSITGVGFQPDLVWIKARSFAWAHRLADSVRGAGKELFSNDTSAELTNDANGYVSAFNSDGFSFPGGGVGVNENNTTYVAWNWNAGGSTVTNTSGTISAQVRANTTSGFSIVTYTGNGSSGATIGHGLGVAPSMFIVKSRGTTDSWGVYHVSLGNTKGLYLETTGAAVTSSAFWNNTSPTSTVFSVSNNSINNASSTNYVAYCFAPVAGYSAFGSYTGNGSTDGPFVYTGFRPRYLMVKRSDSTGDWIILDTSRDTYNLCTKLLYPNLSNAEETYNVTDILSNGFKQRNVFGALNASGGTYIYMALAESPFKFSLAR